MPLSFLETPVYFNHFYLSHILKPGDRVLDATCGNGHDTLFLAQQVLTKEKGWVYALDIQQKALDQTEKRLQQHLESELLQKVSFKQGCHSDLSSFKKESLDLILYNFGYLPGSNHSLTTKSKTSLTSLPLALELIKPKAYLSLTCYPGHPEGKNEADEILSWAQKLNSKDYLCCLHRWINRKESAPFLILIQRKL